MTTEKPVLFYAGEFGFCFSNSSSFAVEWHGRLWMTSEHAYQAAKFDDLNIIDEIHRARSSHLALQIAKHRYPSLVRSTWKDEKLAVMEDILRHKLQQHKYVAQKLRESGSRELIENSEENAFWGRGPDWKGQNHCGKLWMKLRDELLAQ